MPEAWLTFRTQLKLQPLKKEMFSQTLLKQVFIDFAPCQNQAELQKSHFGFSLAVIEIPSNRIYQEYCCAADPPETAHISD